jgi:hypothetical protein
MRFFINPPHATPHGQNRFPSSSFFFAFHRTARLPFCVFYVMAFAGQRTKSTLVFFVPQKTK